MSAMAYNYGRVIYEIVRDLSMHYSNSQAPSSPFTARPTIEEVMPLQEMMPPEPGRPEPILSCVNRILDGARLKNDDELAFELRDGPCGLAELVLSDQRHVVGWVNDNKIPSGSLNQATFAPDGAVQIPSASCCIKG